MSNRLLSLVAALVLVMAYILLGCVLKYQNNVCWWEFTGCK